jgi:5-methylcytosine-specific restriction endonuclease McrA
MRKGSHPSVRFDAVRGCEVKTCTVCHVEKSLTDFYTRPGGYRPRCKACEIAGNRARYTTEPEKYRAKWRDFHVAHREARVAQSLRWREQNPEKYRAYYIGRNEAQREYQRAWARRNHAKETKEFRAMQYLGRRPYFLRYNRLWRAANTQRAIEQRAQRRARVLHAPVIEPIDRAAIIARDQGICYRCGLLPTGRNLTLDHVVPLTRGGHHTADNLRVCCRSCNSRKWKHLLTEL